MRWACGVTTCSSRLNTLLPTTLRSVAAAGFDKPRLFIDGEWLPPKSLDGYEVTCHHPALRTAGNWYLAATELYFRHPEAEMYAIFQDDLIICRSVKKYIERTYPSENCYLNLYTFPKNQSMANGRKGWYPSDQLGKGAVALAFRRDALMALLTAPQLIERAQDPQRGWKSIDGGIIHGMKGCQWREYVHNPSLTQHVGHESSMGNHKHPQATSFPGEAFDALSLLPGANQ